MDVLNLGASLMDADLARKAREDELLWHEQDLKFHDLQRDWQATSLLRRDEDIRWRREEVFQRDLHTRMREIDEKNETLKNTGNVAALVCVLIMYDIKRFDVMSRSCIA
jgi:hypothetical protein